MAAQVAHASRDHANNRGDAEGDAKHIIELSQPEGPSRFKCIAYASFQPSFILTHLTFQIALPLPVLRREVWRTVMKIRPLHDRVVLRRTAPEAKTSAGIIVPDTAREKPMKGE